MAKYKPGDILYFGNDLICITAARVKKKYMNNDLLCYEFYRLHTPHQICYESEYFLDYELKFIYSKADLSYG